MKDSLRTLNIILLLILGVILVIIPIIYLFVFPNPCNQINCNLYLIFLVCGFIVISALLWYSIHNVIKMNQNETAHRIQMKERIITTYLEKSNNEQLSNNLNDFIKNLNEIYQGK